MISGLITFTVVQGVVQCHVTDALEKMRSMKNRRIFHMASISGYTFTMDELSNILLLNKMYADHRVMFIGLQHYC